MNVTSMSLLALDFGSPSMLFGLGAAAIPIIIHLLSKRRYQETDWAAMKFLMEAARKQSRRLRWEQLLLLLVRCLAVMLLATAFARPFFENAFSSMSGREPRHYIVILDDSFSMGYATGNESRLDQGKEAVRQLIQSSQTGDAFSLLSLSPFSQSDLIAPTFRRDSLIGELDSIDVTELTADLTGTFAQLESLLKESPQPRDKEILIVSDFQQRDWDPAGNRKELLEAQIARLAADNTRFTFLNVGGADPGNYALTDVTVAPQPVLVGQPSTVSVSIERFGMPQNTELSVELLIDDRSMGTQSVADWEGGETEIFFPCEWREAGSHQIVVRLLSDRLEVDNQRYHVTVVRDAIRVLLVEGRPAGGVREQSSHYLQTALQTVTHPVNNEPLFEITVTDLLGMSNRAAEPFDVIALCNLPGLNQQQRSLVRRHLSEGRGLLLVHGDQTDAQTWSHILNQLSEESWPVSLKQTESEDEVWSFLTTELDHPIVNMFSGNPGTGLESAVIWNRTPISVEDERRVTRILTFDDGLPAIFEISLNTGRCVQTTMACDATSGSWAPLNGSFPPIAIEMMRYLAIDLEDRRRDLVGQTLSGLLPGDQFVAEVTVTSPAGQSTSVPVTTPGVQNSLRQWSYENVVRKGFYRVDLGQNSRAPLTFAVNVDPREGNLASADPRDIEDDLFRDPDLNLRITPTISRGEISTFRESSISLWLLWLGLAFLAVEVALAWKFWVGLIAFTAVILIAIVLNLARWIGPAPAISGGVLISCLLLLLVLQRVLAAQRSTKSRMRI